MHHASISMYSKGNFYGERCAANQKGMYKKDKKVFYSSHYKNRIRIVYAPASNTCHASFTFPSSNNFLA